MKRLACILLAASVYAIALGQAAPETAPGAAPGAAVPSAAPGAVPGFMEARVRFVHAAPNTGPVQMVARNRAAVPPGQETAVELAYMQVSDYIDLIEGDYEFVLGPVDGDDGPPLALPQTLFAVGGRSYTVALVGLVTDEGPVVADDGGFLEWLEGLFTPDQPDLGLRAVVLDDVAPTLSTPQEMHVRIVHAAPGTADVELVQVADGAFNVLETVNYLDVGQFHAVLPEAGRFEIRTAGTAAPIVDLGGVDFEPGWVHNVLLVGTPIEAVPLNAIVASAEWVDPWFVTPVGPGPGSPLTTSELIWIRDLLMEIDQRIANADGWLGEAAAAEVARESVAAARQELVTARDLLDQVRLDIEAAERRGVLHPSAPTPAPAQPAAPPAGN
jgi:hypothetical protein